MAAPSTGSAKRSVAPSTGSAKRSVAPSTGSAKRSVAPSTGSAKRSVAPFINTTLLKAVGLVNCLVPAGLLGYYALRGRMGANQVDFLLRSLGTSALVFLLVTLAVTPLRKLLRWQWLGKLRRMFGLFAFFYALCHFVVYLWLDQSLDLMGIAQDVVSRPFVTAGFAALVFMVPLAATSNGYMVRRLGGKRWQALHRRVYAIAILAILHYAWLVKKDLRGPLIYGAILTALLLYRVVDRARERAAV